MEPRWSNLAVGNGPEAAQTATAATARGPAAAAAACRGSDHVPLAVNITKTKEESI